LQAAGGLFAQLAPQLLRSRAAHPLIARLDGPSAGRLLVHTDGEQSGLLTHIATESGLLCTPMKS
jgi:hypothetical protein